jgi:hypothetical protein
MKRPSSTFLRCRPGLWLCALTIGASVAGGPTPAARAADLDEPARLAEAERACLTGKHERGVELLAELYVATRHPAYLHNQARCYEQNGQYRLAAGRYREFLRKLKELPPDQITAETRLTPEKIAAIEANATRLEQLVPEEGGAGAARARPAITGLPPEKGEARNDALAATAIAPADRPAGGGALRASGIAVATLGVLAGAGGAIAGLVAKRTEEDITAASGRGNEPFDANQYDRGRLAAQLSTVGLIAGPALVVTGALLYWRGAAARTTDRAALTVTPALSAGAIGALVTARY